MQCTGQGNNGLLCSFYHLVLWQEQFYYITSGENGESATHENLHIWFRGPSCSPLFQQLLVGQCLQLVTNAMHFPSNKVAQCIVPDTNSVTQLLFVTILLL